MSCGPTDRARRDLVCARIGILLWWLPAALVLVGLWAPSLRAALWIPSFAVMGIACLANARRCGRLHCFLTGPLFLFGSVATALDAGPWLVLVIVAAGTVAAFALEWLRGSYVGTSRSEVIP